MFTPKPGCKIVLELGGGGMVKLTCNHMSEGAPSPVRGWGWGTWSPERASDLPDATQEVGRAAGALFPCPMMTAVPGPLETLRSKVAAQGRCRFPAGATPLSPSCQVFQVNPSSGSASVQDGERGW